MKMRKFAVTGVVAGAVFSLASGSAWAAPDNSTGQAQTVPAPATETILSAPAETKRLFQPARPQQVVPVQIAEPVERAGLSRPVRVYWYIGGR
jgi:transposase